MDSPFSSGDCLDLLLELLLDAVLGLRSLVLPCSSFVGKGAAADACDELGTLGMDVPCEDCDGLLFVRVVSSP